MLYLIYGTEKDKARAKAHELLATLKAKRPDAEVFRMDGSNFEQGRFDEIVYGQGLFAPKFIVFLNSIAEDKEQKEHLLSKAEDIAKAENAFIVLEGKLDSASAKILEKNSAKTIVCGIPKEGKPKMAFDIFSLADAFGRKDKKELWVLYQKARRANIEPEEIHGILAWQVRSLAAASGAKTATEAELSPFVFSKASRFLKQFSSEEIQKSAGRLSVLYHDARRGKHDFDSALERFILEL